MRRAAVVTPRREEATRVLIYLIKIAPGFAALNFPARDRDAFVSLAA